MLCLKLVSLKLCGTPSLKECNCASDECSYYYTSETDESRNYCDLELGGPLSRTC